MDIPHPSSGRLTHRAAGALLSNYPFQVTTRLEPTPKTPRNPLIFELLTFAVFA